MSTMHGGVRSIKHAQKESQLLREISRLFTQTASDDHRLMNVTISRILLSPDKSMCSVYFYTADGQKAFKELLDILKLYKPSLRNALSKSLRSRYTPNLIFKFDEQYEKQEKMNQLLDSLKLTGES